MGWRRLDTEGTSEGGGICAVVEGTPTPTPRQDTQNRMIGDSPSWSVFAAGEPTARPRIHVPSHGAGDHAADLAEPDGRTVRTRCCRRYDNRIAVLQERALGSVVELDRIASAPGQLQKRPGLAALRPGDRAGSIEITGPQAGAVHGHVGQ